MANPSHSGCLDPDTAAAYAEHRLRAAERLQIDEHIDQCAACRELVSALARVQSSDDLEPGPLTAVAGELSAASASGPAPTAIGVLPPGTVVGPYEIEQPLDAGGMGLVYTAHDSRLARKVALKGLRELGGRAEQLLQEARTMAQLSHPNVVAVYDVLEAHGQHFLAMELVVGQSVRQWLDAHPRGWKEVVDVFLAAGAGLAAAHDAGIVHGDVKPANLLYGDDGRARITDFGLSSKSASDLPRTAGLRGTPAYMAPEQRRGERCDALGDQYSFCASLHEALFGALPGSPERRGNVPRALRRVLVRGLAVERGGRYPSMQHLLRELRAARARRWRWAAAAVAVALAVAVVAYSTAEQRVQARLCEAAATRLRSPWNNELRALVTGAILDAKTQAAPELARRVEANLDRWNQRFEDARDELCTRSWLQRPLPPERFAARLQCLEEKADQASAVIHVLRDAPDATILRNALNATSELAPLERCVAPPPLARPASSETSPARVKLSSQFARVHALHLAGKPLLALPLAQELARAAEATGDPYALASALVTLGSAQTLAGEHKAAAKTLPRALRLAERLPNDLLRTQAWANLLNNEYRQGHYDRVLLMQEAALGAADRVGDQYLLSEVMVIAGGAHSQLGQLAEARELFEQSLAIRRTLYGNRDRRVAAALTALGNTYAMQGDLERGIPAHREAAEIAEELSGAVGGDVGTLLGNLGSDYLYGLQLPDALATLARAASKLESSAGPKSTSTLMVRNDLGLAQLESGALAEASATFEDLCARWAEVSPKHPSHAQALVGRYLTRRARGEAAAVEDLEKALPLARQLPPFLRASVELELAKVSPADRAVGLLTSAIEGFSTSTLPLVKRDLDRATALLAQLRDSAARKNATATPVRSSRP